MRDRTALFALLLAAVCIAPGSFTGMAVPPPATPAPKFDRAAVKPFEELFDKALVGYNERNAAKFYADFSHKAIPPAEPRVFVALFQGVYLIEFGRCISKKLNKKETVPHPQRGVLVYDAVFEKANVKLSANFVRENGALKILQIRMEPA